MRFACCINKATNTQNMQQLLYFSTSTVVSRTRLNVTIYVLRLLDAHPSYLVNHKTSIMCIITLIVPRVCQDTTVDFDGRKIQPGPMAHYY